MKKGNRKTGPESKRDKCHVKIAVISLQNVQAKFNQFLQCYKSMTNSASIHHALTKIPSLSSYPLERFLDCTFESHSFILSNLLNHLNLPILSNLLNTREESVLQELRNRVDGFQREANAKAFRKLFYQTAAQQLSSYLSTSLTAISLAKDHSVFISTISKVLIKANLLASSKPTPDPRVETPRPLSESGLPVTPRFDTSTFTPKKRTTPTKSRLQAVKLRLDDCPQLPDSINLLDNYKNKLFQLNKLLIAQSDSISTAKTHLISFLSDPACLDLSSELRHRLNVCLSSLNVNSEVKIIENNSNSDSFLIKNSMKKRAVKVDKSVNVDLIQNNSEDSIPIHIFDSYQEYKKNPSSCKLQEFFELLDEYSVES
ncbi:hypothetical protein RCL1_000396 [Eukaryota sp. TZLM3-RCL]